MTPERRHRVEELYHAALTRAEGESDALSDGRVRR